MTAWEPSPETAVELADAFQWDHGHNWVTRGWVETLLAREYARGKQDAAPPGPACGACGRVCNSWIWDEQDLELEADFEWWKHPPSGHRFLCRRACWLRVHREHCGPGACRTTAIMPS